MNVEFLYHVFGITDEMKKCSFLQIDNDEYTGSLVQGFLENYFIVSAVCISLSKATIYSCQKLLLN